MDFRFYVKIKNSPFLEVFPNSIPKIALKKDKKTGVLRKNISGEIYFGGIIQFKRNDFKLFESLEDSDERCTHILFKITKKCNGENLFTGSFSCNNGDWDRDKCTVSFSVDSNDDYSNLYKKWHVKHNVLDAPLANVEGVFPKDVINPYDYKYGFFLANGEIPEDWASFVKDTITPIGFREETTTDYSGEFPKEPNGDWEYLKKEGNLARWYRFPEFRAIPENVEIKIAPSTSPGADYYKINSTDVEDPAGIATFTFDIYWKIRLNHLKITTSRKIIDVLYHLIEKTDPNLLPDTPSDLSDFFTLDTSYVHGGVNEMKDTYVTDITDIKRPFSSEPATENLMSLKELMEDLQVKFQIEFRIIDGKIRIEHESFFKKTLQNDLTLSNPDRLIGTNKYKFNNHEIPREEQFVDANAVQLDFIGKPIVYDSPCVNKDEENIKSKEIKRLVGDIFSAVLAPSKFAENGLAIYTIVNGKIPMQTGLLDGVDSKFTNIVNHNFAMTYLHDRYFKTGRMMDNGVMNEKQDIFEIGVKPKQQTAITIPLCCEEPKWDELFGTQISKNGELLSATIDLIASTVTLNIIHTIYANGQVALGSQFNDSFDDSFR